MILRRHLNSSYLYRISMKSLYHNTVLLLLRAKYCDRKLLCDSQHSTWRSRINVLLNMWKRQSITASYSVRSPYRKGNKLKINLKFIALEPGKMLSPRIMITRSKHTEYMLLFDLTCQRCSVCHLDNGNSTKGLLIKQLALIVNMLPICFLPCGT